jgi:cytoskeletal protein RodZ
MFGQPENQAQKQSEQPSRHWARKILRYTPIVLLAVLLYVGFVLWSRWQQNKDVEAKEKAEQQEKSQESAREAVDSLGGDQFGILSFYGPAAIRSGDSAQLCYGVSDAKSVSLDPPVARMWPSASRCFDVTPKRDTTYTLTADDGKGDKKTATVTIKVH